jgi:DNA invertase Pin-like site-specific DNA recombinase
MQQRPSQVKRTITAARDGRVFLYVRVSTDRQTDEGHSLADQEHRLRGYVQTLGLTVSGVFIEAGVSGAKRLHTRPKGSELLATLEAGDHVVATKLDRMFRSASDALNVAEDFHKRGVHLHLLDIGGDVTGNGVGKLVFSILAAVAEMERGRISERVRSVKQHLRDGGYFTGGKRPRGYHVTKDGKLETDPRWQECVEWMKCQRTEGQTYRQISASVGERFGITLDHTTVYRILNGKRELDGASVSVPHVEEVEPPSNSSRKRGTERNQKPKKAWKTWPMREEPKHRATAGSKKR